MTSDILSPKSARETYSEAQRALSAIGKVTSSNIGDYTLNGKVRHGLQSVKVRVTVYPDGDTSNVVIEAESDDVWDAGGKSVVTRFRQALNSSDVSGYVPDRQGMSTAKLIGMVALFLLILIPGIIVMTPKSLGGGTVSSDGGVLYFELHTVEEIAELTTGSPGVEEFARRLANSSNPDAVAPAFRAYRDSFQQSNEREFEAAGKIIRVPSHTPFKAIRKTTDAYSLEIYKVRLLSGPHSGAEGYMHSTSLRFAR